MKNSRRNRQAQAKPAAKPGQSRYAAKGRSYIYGLELADDFKDRRQWRSR